jgi:hypothetical protein
MRSSLVGRLRPQFRDKGVAELESVSVEIGVNRRHLTWVRMQLCTVRRWWRRGVNPQLRRAEMTYGTHDPDIGMNRQLESRRSRLSMEAATTDPPCPVADLSRT